MPPTPSAVTALAYDASGLLAAGGADGVVRLIDGSGTVVGRLDGEGDPVTSVAFAPDGRTIAVSYAHPPGGAAMVAPSIRLWDASTYQQANDGVTAGPSNEVDAVAFSPDGSRAASVGRSWVGLFDTQKWESHALFSQPDRHYAGVGFSPDGDTVAVGGRDPATSRDHIVLSAVADSDAQPAATLSVDGDLAVDALSFSPDGRLIASVGPTGTQLWDVVTDLPLGLALGTSARALAFAPDGSVFAVGQDDGRVVVYPATVDGWEQAVCSMVGRNLSAAEWATFVRVRCPTSRPARSIRPLLERESGYSSERRNRRTELESSSMRIRFGAATQSGSANSRSASRPLPATTPTRQPRARATRYSAAAIWPPLTPKSFTSAERDAGGHEVCKRAQRLSNAEAVVGYPSHLVIPGVELGVVGHRRRRIADGDDPIVMELPNVGAQSGDPAVRSAGDDESSERAEALAQLTSMSRQPGASGLVGSAGEDDDRRLRVHAVDRGRARQSAASDVGAGSGPHGPARGDRWPTSIRPGRPDCAQLGQ